MTRVATYPSGEYGLAGPERDNGGGSAKKSREEKLMRNLLWKNDKVEQNNKETLTARVSTQKHLSLIWLDISSKTYHFWLSVAGLESQ